MRDSNCNLTSLVVFVPNVSEAPFLILVLLYELLVSDVLVSLVSSPLAFLSFFLLIEPGRVFVTPFRGLLLDFILFLFSICTIVTEF